MHVRSLTCGRFGVTLKLVKPDYFNNGSRQQSRRKDRQAVDIVDRVAVVTGAGSGLGRATALALAKAGARVAVLDRNTEAARSVAEVAGAPTVPVTVDVADRASVAAAIAEVAGTFGRADVCINAAGIPNPGKVFGKSGPLDIEQFQRVIDVNLVGAFDVMRQCAALMTRNTDPGLDGERGVIINVSSGAAFEGQKGQAAYSASKAGLIGLMLPAARALAVRHRHLRRSRSQGCSSPRLGRAQPVATG